MSQIKEGLYYAKSHEWAEVQGDIARIGITDFAQNQLGDMVFAEAAPLGRQLMAGQPIGVVESVKSASDLYSPVSGEIVESNAEVGKAPEKINTDPFAVWFVAIRISDPSELRGLMDAAAYQAFCLAEA